jgi:hypothetical protein
MAPKKAKPLTPNYGLNHSTKALEQAINGTKYHQSAGKSIETIKDDFHKAVLPAISAVK